MAEGRDVAKCVLALKSYPIAIGVTYTRISSAKARHDHIYGRERGLQLSRCLEEGPRPAALVTTQRVGLGISSVQLDGVGQTIWN